jgi:hypothetical protein
MDITIIQECCFDKQMCTYALQKVVAERERLIQILYKEMESLDKSGRYLAAQAFDTAIALLQRV